MTAGAHEGRPLDLPLWAEPEDFGLSREFLRVAVPEALARKTTGKGGEKRAGIFDPTVGRLVGKNLAPRMGALLNRPGCTFANAYVWRFGRGAALSPHTDRAPLDVTMTVSVILEGADAWPLGVQQPNGDVLEWPSRPGTALILDGRWRPHWRRAFTGERAVVLLLHWRAPAVRWPGFLSADACARLRGGRGAAIEPSDVERCADLVRLAAPPGGTPEVSRCDRRLRALPVGSVHGDARFLVLLDGELTVTLDALDPVALTPGDGIAFPAWEKCRLDWTAPNGRGTALLGYARTPPAQDGGMMETAQGSP